jgi:acetyl esterase
MTGADLAKEGGSIGARVGRSRSTGSAPPIERGKYRDLLDPEIWAFIDRTNQFDPPETVAYPIAQQRAIYDAMCRAFHHGRPAGVRAQDSTIKSADGALAVRRYQAGGKRPAATILYYHGGGFILGGLDSHDDVCAELCAGTGYDVLSADYRLAPEHPHPAAFDDACAVFDWAAAAFDLPMILCGESAGGNLAAAVAHAKRRHRRHAIGQVLIYPSLGRDMSGRSYAEHGDAPMLTVRDLLFYRDIRTGGRPSGPDATLAPLEDADFSGLPPTVIVTAQCDPLSSDGEAYRDWIAAAGGRAWWREEPGLVHSFLRARHSARRAREGFAGIVAAATALGQGQWPY